MDQPIDLLMDEESVHQFVNDMMDLDLNPGMQLPQEPLQHAPLEFIDFLNANRPMSTWTRLMKSLPNANLSEHIKAYHDHISNNPEGPLPHSPAEGSAQGPDGSHSLPTVLRPWTSFMEEQKAVMDKVHSVFPADMRVFPNEHRVYRLRNRPRERDEDVFSHLSFGVVGPVQRIIWRLEAERSDEVHVEGRIFDYLVTIDGSGAMVWDDDWEDNFNPEISLTTCVGPIVEEAVRRGDGYLTVYKSPLKAPVSPLRQGLRSMAGLEQDAGPNDPQVAHGVAAATIGQVYRAMVLGGLEFGCFVTGDAYLFLRIDWDDPGVLYYHLAEPREEVEAHPVDPVSYTAVGQLLAFAIRALRMG